MDISTRGTGLGIRNTHERNRCTGPSTSPATSRCCTHAGVYRQGVSKYRYTVRVRRRPEHLATGYVRAAALFALLIGIVLMHAVVAAHIPPHSAEHLAAQSISTHSTSLDNTASTPALSMDMQSTPHHQLMGAVAGFASMGMPGGGMGLGCGDGCCLISGGMHACVFILVTLMVLFGLALLGRVGDGLFAAARVGGAAAAGYARPPPWVTLSLAELSILRI